MNGIATVIFLLSGLALVPAFLLSMYCSYAFNQHLEEAHPEVWKEVAPDPSAEPSYSSPNARFITLRKYRSLNDETLNRLGNRSYLAEHLVVTVFVVFILSLIFQSFT